MTYEELMALANADGKKRKKPGHEEDSIQIRCVTWFGLQYPELKKLLHHSPNGGKRDSKTGANFKRMGTRAGFPDLFLYVANEKYHGLAIEMKTDRGKQQPTQKEYEALLTGQGYKYIICRSLNEFEKIITEYLD